MMNLGFFQILMIKKKKSPKTHPSPKPVLINNIWWHPSLGFPITSCHRLIKSAPGQNVSPSI